MVLKRKLAMTNDIKQFETFSTKELATKDKYYLLLEGDLNENLYREVSDFRLMVSKRWVYEYTEFDDEKEHGPLLVEIDADNKLLEHFISHWSQQHMGVIISTQASLEELMEHLLDLRYVTIPNVDPLQKVLFRWYEPRQLFGVLSGFDEKQTAYFMHVITSISWCEWAYDQGIWYQIIKPEIDGEDQESINKFVAPLAIEQNTLDVMDTHDANYYAREVTREIIDKHPSILKKGSEDELRDSVLNQMRLAIRQGIERRNDIKALIYDNINLEVEKT